jgi:hypothetical protein
VKGSEGKGRVKGMEGEIKGEWKEEVEGEGEGR